MNKVKVVDRSKEDNGNIISKYDSNAILNTMVYNVKFPDGSIYKYGTNIIAYNIYSQVYSEVFSHPIPSGILDFAKDTTAVQKGDQYIITNSRQLRMIKSTVRWNLLISWKGGSKQWIPLLVMKEYNPIEVAKFTTSHDIYDEPTFVWWVPYTLQKRDKNYLCCQLPGKTINTQVLCGHFLIS